MSSSRIRTPSIAPYPVGKRYTSSPVWLANVLVIGACIVSVIGWVILLASPFMLVRTLLSFQLEKAMERLLFIVIGAYSALVVPGLVNGLLPAIKIKGEGLRVRIFCFVWKFVPWEEVKGIVASSLPRGMVSPGVWAIRVSRLTLGHRFLGMVFGVGWSPVIAIGYLRDWEELLDIVEARTAIVQGSSCDTKGG